MYIVYFHLCCDQIFHKLSEGGLWVSFTPFPSSCNTNAFSDGLENATGVNPGVNLELVPVGGDDPGEGVPGDHKAGGVLELLDVGQLRCPLPEDPMELVMILLIIACILDVGNKEPG